MIPLILVINLTSPVYRMVKGLRTDGLLSNTQGGRESSMTLRGEESSGRLHYSSIVRPIRTLGHTSSSSEKATRRKDNENERLRDGATTNMHRSNTSHHLEKGRFSRKPGCSRAGHKEPGRFHYSSIVSPIRRKTRENERLRDGTWNNKEHAPE